MNPGVAPQLRSWLERTEVLAIDPERIRALARALQDGEAPVAVGRWGALVAFAPGPARRRIVQFDRRGHLIAAVRWREDGALGWAKCRTADGQWVGIEPAAAEHPAWGSSDRIWLLDATAPWKPRHALTLFQSLDYARPDFIPPLLEPRRLPPGAGTAILDLIASLMNDQGATRVRYRGPYPTEQLFTSLLESFRYEPSATDPLTRFLEGALDWQPAPHERHHPAPGLCVQLRHEVEKVTLDGVTFYQTGWQTVVRREPRVVRSDGDRFICSLWALGRSLQDRLILDRTGEILDRPPVAPDHTPPAPLAPVWSAALGDLIARESAPALSSSIGEVMRTLSLQWAPVTGDLLHVEGETVTISRRLRDVAEAWLREAAPENERARRAVEFALEVARLLGPTVRLAAQMRLERQSEEEQRRALDGEHPPVLSESVGRLLALIAAGHA